MACARSHASFRHDSSFRSFLFGIAHNVLRSHVRSRIREDQRLDWTEVSAEALDPSPSEIAVKRDEQRAILSALRRIPLACQTVLELYYWEDLTASDVAAALGLNEGTVRSRVRRGKALLTQELLRLGEDSRLRATVEQVDAVARSLAPAGAK
ncbi:MAG: RNA polymerase sigma factor [Nannocystaceae bacterium]